MPGLGRESDALLDGGQGEDPGRPGQPRRMPGSGS